MNMRWMGLMIVLALGCGRSQEPSVPTEKAPETPAKEPVEPTKVPTKTDADWAQVLTGRWEGMQVLRNSHGAVPYTGVVHLVAGNHLTFDGKLEGRSMRRPIVGFGVWRVKDGQLVMTVEGSNLANEIPNGTTRTLIIKEVSDHEFLYVDPIDQKTYSATRLGSEVAPPAEGKALKKSGPNKK